MVLLVWAVWASCGGFIFWESIVWRMVSPAEMNGMRNISSAMYQRPFCHSGVFQNMSDGFSIMLRPRKWKLMFLSLSANSATPGLETISAKCSCSTLAMVIWE